jgi:hypothetical protein
LCRLFHPGWPSWTTFHTRIAARGLVAVIQDDDDGVIDVDEDRVMRTAPFGVVSGAVVTVVTRLSSD